MKKTYFRKSIALLMAVALLIWLPCGALGDGVAMPAFNLDAGTYTEAKNVAITCATEGAKIYYTTNGSDPTTADSEYSAPILIAETTTLKAAATLDGTTYSEVATAEYKITYAVTVTNGTASINSQSITCAEKGDSVTITANDPEAGKQFKNWTGLGDLVSDENATKKTVNFTMPAAAVTATANYEDIYTVTVDGNEIGSYAAGARVTITADVPEGTLFAEWTGLDNVTFADGCDATQNPTSFEMPARNVAATSIVKYPVAVTNGNGSGNYAAGTDVTITAYDPEGGKQFTNWTGTEGLTFSNGSADTATATFTMPANAVAVTANFDDIPPTTYAVTITNGKINGGTENPVLFAADTAVTIKANDPESGKRFKAWECSGNLTFTSGSATSAEATFTMPGNAVTVTATYEDILYPVTVNYGSGTANYAMGSNVTIKAADPESGKQFRQWTGADGLSFDRNKAETSFTMPANAVEVTATYDDLYAVTVSNGSGSGSYVAGASVVIAAGAAPDGQQFKEWTGADELSFTAGGKNTASATFTMPAKAVTVTAAFEPIPAVNYAATVHNGSGSGNYGEGASVTITAGEAPAGQQFKEWTGAEGLAFTSGDKNSATAAFTMPAGTVEVTATYEDIPVVYYTVAVNNGSGSGRYTEGTGVAITASKPEAGKRFKGWVYEGELSFTSGNQTVSTATFTMPPRDVTITATYADIEVYVVDDNVSNNESPGTVQDPNKTYAPDGTEYNPDTGDTDKSGLYAVSGGAQGPSLDITKIVKTETVTTGNQGKGGSGSAGSVSTGSASKASTVVSSEGPDSENETGTENAEAVDADYDGIYSVGGGYNVILVGLSEQMMQGETWPLLLQRGIVYEDYEQGEATPADAATLLQAGMEGVRKEENPGYWSSPGAATTPEEMINQFGFYGLMEREKQDTDSKALIDAALRLRDEGLIMNARRVPFFMDVQLTGNGGEGDTLRKLITELENDGLGGNTVLFFVPMGKETDKNPLVIVHPVILDGMTVKTPTKIEDVLATILTLSGNTNASQYEVLKTMPGRNLLMTEEFQGVEGLIPEVAEEAEAEEPAAPSGTAVSLPESRINLEKQGSNGTGMGDPEEKTRQQTETKNVNTHSAGPGEGTEETELLAPGSEIPVSEGPGGAGGSGQNASGPAAEETDQGPAHP